MFHKVHHQVDLVHVAAHHHLLGERRLESGGRVWGVGGGMRGVEGGLGSVGEVRGEKRRR